MTVRIGHKVKAALLQIHSVAGLVLALLLALIALTGAIMSFEDEIVDQLNAGIMQGMPLSQQEVVLRHRYKVVERWLAATET